MYKKMKLHDKIIADAINNELKRQQDHIELIASENYVSEDVLKTNGSVLTNKYGEGYPEKRYYDGCENVDIVENTAIERLKKLFKVKFANVQPYSGSIANAAAFAAVLKPGDKILGMSLNSGGHLTHGYKISFSGIIYEAYSYDVNEQGFIDYEQVLKIAQKVKPKLIICGYSAYSQEVNFVEFRKIADAVGAYLLADIAHIAGLIVAGQHMSPVGYADIITSTTHKTLRGSRGAFILTDDEKLAKKIDSGVFPGQQGGPLFHAIAGKAVAFLEAQQPFFKKYAKNVVANAKAFAKQFLKLHVPVISGGTVNHLFIIDVLKGYNLSGKKAAEILSSINITTNKNSIPNDTLSPMVASGVRLGTAAMTSRGFGKKEFVELAKIINSVLKHPEDLKLHQAAKKQVKALTKAFPIKKSYWEN
ncbi:serine hydroxymethyltransferase [Candidatus Mycoplasma pogonae]